MSPVKCFKWIEYIQLAQTANIKPWEIPRSLEIHTATWSWIITWDVTNSFNEKKKGQHSREHCQFPDTSKHCTRLQCGSS